jgi:hypothetical protein
MIGPPNPSEANIFDQQKRYGNQPARRFLTQARANAFAFAKVLW